LIACLEVRGDLSEWQVEIDGLPARAVAYASLTGALRPGDEVLLNTTAVSLALGTGGVHLVLARLHPAVESGHPHFAGREAGHILKLRYTPLQLRVCPVEDEASPHRSAYQQFRGLHGTPVVAAELLSQAAACAVAARAAGPHLRIVLIHLDSAALPLAFSRLIGQLRNAGILSATVTVGQSFGGDYEAINVYSGLAAAKSVAGADLVLVSQGPGNAGTGTELGFSGLSLVEALHAAEFLGGEPVLIPRLSEGEGRLRHQGLSHHTRTLLRCLRVGAVLPVPDAATGSLMPAEQSPPHRCMLECPEPVWPALETRREWLTTMGRGLDQDRLFFRTAAAAGLYAARRAHGLNENS
jgi:hypothetical protein